MLTNSLRHTSSKVDVLVTRLFLSVALWLCSVGCGKGDMSDYPPLVSFPHRSDDIAKAAAVLVGSYQSIRRSVHPLPPIGILTTLFSLSG